MLKQSALSDKATKLIAAAFGRLCVETALPFTGITQNTRQPPSGGCVLKQEWLAIFGLLIGAAAFGRLCVETMPMMKVS